MTTFSQFLHCWVKPAVAPSDATMFAKTTKWTLAAILLAIASANIAAAQQPGYLILRPSAKAEPSCQGDQWKPSKNHYVSRAPYAYGYFGATASDKWYRSNNYSRSYTQWQRR